MSQEKGGTFDFGPNENLACRFPMSAEENLKKDKEPPRMYELTWRIFRIMSEFVEGFQFLSESKKEVTIFGSARFKPLNKWYRESRKLGQLLAKNGFTVITGGGPGIMEAGNRGASEKKGISIGLNIQLPTEQRVNKYVNRSRGFHYFFTRKVILAASAQAYIFFPGGYGTLDELFEIIVLIQTKKAQTVPIVLVGHSFWDPLINWIEVSLLKKNKTISSGDQKIFTVVNTAQQAFDLIKDSEERSFF